MPGDATLVSATAPDGLSARVSGRHRLASAPRVAVRPRWCAARGDGHESHRAEVIPGIASPRHDREAARTPLLESRRNLRRQRIDRPPPHVLRLLAHHQRRVIRDDDGDPDVEMRGAAPKADESAWWSRSYMSGSARPERRHLSPPAVRAARPPRSTRRRARDAAGLHPEPPLGVEHEQRAGQRRIEHERRRGGVVGPSSRETGPCSSGKKREKSAWASRQALRRCRGARRPGAARRRRERSRGFLLGTGRTGGSIG